MAKICIVLQISMRFVKRKIGHSTPTTEIQLPLIGEKRPFDGDKARLMKIRYRRGRKRSRLNILLIKVCFIKGIFREIL